MKALFRNKKGQLFIIEAFIAVSVMIIMVTALYEVQLATQPTSEMNFHENIYSTMKALDNNGVLDEFVYALKIDSVIDISSQKAIIQQALYSALPDNGEFRLYCQNVTSSEIMTNSWINQHLSLATEAIGIDYMITEIMGEFDPCIFHLHVWLKGV
jgi:hypothetical protein